MSRHTAGILLIGNELLSGKVADENAHFLSRELFAMGIEVRRVVVVPDETDEIVEALLDLRSRVDLVFTSGGIGPTHDDITVASVAKALDRPLEVDPALVERVKKFFGENLNDSHYKMATIPKDCTLVETERTRWPALAVDKVFVLAGVPKILHRSFGAIKEKGLLPSGTPQHLTTIFVKTDEWTLAPILDQTLNAHPDVAIGSYPVLNEPIYRVRITIESTDASNVDAAAQFLIEGLPGKDVVRVETALTKSASD